MTLPLPHQGTDLRAIGPDEARMWFDTGVWGDDQMVAWLLSRVPQGSEEDARKIVAFMHRQNAGQGGKD